jgi:hypothetical protein
MEASQRVAAHAFLVEGGLQADLDTAARADAKSLDLKAARILPEVLVATWVVHRLQEIFLPTVAQVPGYCEKPATKKIELGIFNN